MIAFVNKKPHAKLDLVEIAGHISEDSLDSALRFIDAAEVSFNLLASSPEIGRNCDFSDPESANMRLWRVKGFEKYLIFYRPIPDGVDIVRVIHGSRDIETIFDEE